jgi:hypothetical protein
LRQLAEGTSADPAVVPTARLEGMEEKMTTRTLVSTGTPRLLDSEAKAVWFNEIWKKVSSHEIDAKIGIASIKHAESAGYILPSDEEGFIEKLYPFTEKTIKKGYIILLGDESNHTAIRQMIKFAVAVSDNKSFAEGTSADPAYLNTDVFYISSSSRTARVVPTARPEYIKFMALLDDPPDNLTLAELRWQVEIWVAGIVAALYDLQVGWKDGRLVADIGGFDE